MKALNEMKKFRKPSKLFLEKKKTCLMIKAFGKGRKALTKFYFTFLYTCSCCKLRLLWKISSFAYPSGPNYTSQGTNLLVWLAPYPEVIFNKITDFFSKPPIVTRLKRGVGEVLNF